MIKYRTRSYQDMKIEAVEVTRETDKTIWYISEFWDKGKERRASKNSGDDKYWDTWEQARDYLVNKIKMRIARDEGRLAILMEVEQPTPCGEA
jgi:hypothetical protein